MKKVLIITYYFPPSGGPAVQRIINFIKYLPEFGWNPLILTVKNGEFPAIDHTLRIPDNCKVHKTFSLEPNFLYKKFTGLKRDDSIPVAVISNKNANWKKRLSNWIRLNIFIPDAKIGWLPFAVKKGKEIILSEKPDLIFSSAPPQTVHLIAQKLSEWSKIKWIADFRDPWTDIYHYDDVKRNSLSRIIERKMEKKVLENADRISVVSNDIIRLIREKIEDISKFELITNGFDEQELAGLEEIAKYDKFTMIYSGKMNEQQNPANLWKSLQNLINENSEFRDHFQLIIYGNIVPNLIEEIKKFIPEPNVKMYPYIPHKLLLKVLKKSHISLLLIPNTEKNRGIITGKLFDYLAVENFIIGLGPVGGDADEILHKTNCGKMFDYDDLESIRSEMIEQFENWRSGKILEIYRTEKQQYTRRQLTVKLADVFDKLK
ncbi:MAG: glycosyltransferase family 4 protein [Candidatus Cloacimonetes bacterium]|nr:glycosyltransferase family 4 protein [Candidatus Cloacimonadota bacterium]